MTTVLVTGGAGFIGSNFVAHLFQNQPEYKIIVLDALTYAGRRESGPEGARDSGRFEFWHGDVRNAELVDTLVARADIVVHMAAESHVTRSIFNDRVFFETDVLGTQTVAHAVVRHRHRVERLIHISTSEVYGTAVREAMCEDHPLNPMSPYAAAKCGGDRLVHAYCATYDLPAIIVRPFNNYGPGQHLEKAIPRFITSCLLDEPITVHGDGSAARDWVFVGDHCAALESLLTADLDVFGGRVVNIGTGHARSILEVATAVRDAVPGAGHLPLEFVGERPGQVMRHTCDPSRARRLLGWTAETSFEEGLEATVRWYMDNEEWWRPQLWMRHTPILTSGGTCEMH
jgi:dTDP-glucose 4,6-dehydratase